MEYDKLYNQLTKDQQDQFGGWWHSFSTKNTIVTEDEQGFDNAVEILKWTKGRSLDSRTLDLAVSNLTATQGLHLVPMRQQESQGRPGHTSDGKGLFSKDDTNLSARDHQKLAAEAAAKASGKSEPTPGTDFRALADAVKGSTHSKTEQIQKMFTTRPGTSDIDYEQTYYARRRAAGL